MPRNKGKDTKTSAIDRAYLISAGRKPKPAHRPITVRPRKDRFLSFYKNEGLSFRSIAEKLVCSKNIIYRALKEYGIELRGHSEKRSRLADYDVNQLIAEVRQIGLRAMVREMGVRYPALCADLEKNKVDSNNGGRMSHSQHYKKI